MVYLETSRAFGALIVRVEESQQLRNQFLVDGRRSSLDKCFRDKLKESADIDGFQSLTWPQYSAGTVTPEYSHPTIESATIPSTTVLNIVSCSWVPLFSSQKPTQQVIFICGSSSAL